MGYTLPALLLFFVVSEVAHGDLYWESEVVTKGVPAGLPNNLPKHVLGQFNKTDTVKSYLMSNASRTDTSDGIIITHFDTMTMYQLNANDKTYTKVNLSSVMDSQLGQGMMKGTTEGLKVTPTGETKKIAGYTCKKYNMTMNGSKSEYWLSKDVKGFKEFSAFGKKMEKMLKKNPALRQMSLMGKLDGFPVQTVTNMMGITATTTLKSIEKKPLTTDLFKIPKGYTLRQPGFPEGMRPERR
jgi:hypothetical protein